MKSLFIVLAFFLSNIKGDWAAAHEGESDPASNVGPTKGVLEVSPLGFRVREGVEERFRIKTRLVNDFLGFVVPKSALVFSKEDYQIFRKRDGFWKAIDVEASRKGESFAIKSNEFKGSDAIAVEGVSLLKIIELSVTRAGPDDHHD